MATLVAAATGNFTTAATWKVALATGLVVTETNSTVLTTAYTGMRSPTFTPGAVTIDAIAIKLSQRVGTTGTISVALEQGGVVVVGTEVTINVSDLPATTTANPQWVLFKFAASVTLVAATLYTVAAKTSSASQVNVYRTSTTGDLNKFLRTTTTQAPAAADNMLVLRERTGAGAGTNFTVTMQNTATTDFGSNPGVTAAPYLPGLGIGDGCTVTFDSGSAANPYLRLSNSCIVYTGGTLNIGTTGTPIPRDSVASLYFDNVNDGDYGLIARTGSTISVVGLSRTSGKDVTRARVTANVNASDTTINLDTDTGWLDNDRVVVCGSLAYTDTEDGLLNGNAGASSITIDNFPGAGGSILNFHYGTDERAVYVGLITRNVVVAGLNSGFASFVLVQTTSNTFEWVLFDRMGTTSTGKRGVEIATSNFHVKFCAFWRFESHGLYILSQITANSYAEDNVFYDCGTAGSGAPYAEANTSTTGNYVSLRRNLAVYWGSNGFSFATCASLVEYNVVTCGVSFGVCFLYQNISSNTTLTFNYNYGSISGTAFFFSDASRIRATCVGNVAQWQVSAGLSFNGFVSPAFKFNDSIIFNCGSYCVQFATGGWIDWSGNSWFSGPDQGACTGVYVTGGQLIARFENCDFGVGLGYAGGGEDLLAEFDSSTHQDQRILQIDMIDCDWTNTYITFGSVIDDNYYILHEDSFISSGYHASKPEHTIVRGARLMRETTVFRTAAPSLAMLPKDVGGLGVSGKAKSAPRGKGMQVAVASGQTVTIGVYIRKTSGYTGAQPRLYLRANNSLGIASDTLIDTMSVGANTWEQLTGTTAAVSRDGVLEFYVDFDGDVGTVFLDDWSAT